MGLPRMDEEEEKEIMECCSWSSYDMLGVILFVVFVIFSCSLLPRHTYYIAQLKPYTPFYLISPYQKRGKETL